MKVTLYKPSQPPLLLTVEEFFKDPLHGAHRIERVAEILGCPPALVDVLALGKDFTMYSVFDADGPLNPVATEVFLALTGAEFADGWETDMLSGPVLVLCF